MIYFIIGAIIALVLMSPLGSELMRGYDSFMNYLYLRQAKGDSLEALKNHRETKERVDDLFDDKVGKHGAGRVLGVGLLVVLLLWPVYVIIYLLSLKWHA